MTTSLADRNLSLEAGETVEVTPERAASWIDAGVAIATTSDELATPERRTAPYETRRRVGRPRKS
jgi:hypothetical protein